MKRVLAALLWCGASFAQQSLFNVPSAELTPPKKIFFQEQLNLSEDGISSNSVFAYGLIPHLEVGVDLLNLTAHFKDGFGITVFDHPSGQALAPLAAVSALSVWQMQPWWRFGFGGLAGTNVAGRVAAKLATFGYVQNAFTFGIVQFYLGGFVANCGFVGSDSVVANFMAGIDVEITPRLHFVADHIHGIHDLGVSVPGLAYYVTKHFVVSAGAQLPNARAADPFGAVLELTLLPDDHG